MRFDGSEFRSCPGKLSCVAGSLFIPQDQQEVTYRAASNCASAAIARAINATRQDIGTIFPTLVHFTQLQVTRTCGCCSRPRCMAIPLWCCMVCFRWGTSTDCVVLWNADTHQDPPTFFQEHELLSRSRSRSEEVAGELCFRRSVIALL